MGDAPLPSAALQLRSLVASYAVLSVTTLAIHRVGIGRALPTFTMLSSGEVFEVYLQFQPFREIVPELRVLVQPLRSLEAMVPVRAEGYYATALDSALVALRFDRAAADRFGRARLGRCVAEIGVPLIVPEQLSFERRCAFFLNHLTSYTIYVQAHAEDGAEERGPIESVIVRLSQHARAASAAGLALRRSAMAHAGRAATPPPA